MHNSCSTWTAMYRCLHISSQKACSLQERRKRYATTFTIACTKVAKILLQLQSRFLYPAAIDRNAAFMDHIKNSADRALADLYEGLTLAQQWRLAEILQPHLHRSIPGYTEPEAVRVCWPLCQLKVPTVRRGTVRRHGGLMKRRSASIDSSS